MDSITGNNTPEYNNSPFGSFVSAARAGWQAMQKSWSISQNMGLRNRIESALKSAQAGFQASLRGEDDRRAVRESFERMLNLGAPVGAQAYAIEPGGKVTPLHITGPTVVKQPKFREETPVLRSITEGMGWTARLHAAEEAERARANEPVDLLAPVKDLSQPLPGKIVDFKTKRALTIETRPPLGLRQDEIPVIEAGSGQRLLPDTGTDSHRPRKD